MFMGVTHFDVTIGNLQVPTYNMFLLSYAHYLFLMIGVL